MTIIYQYAGLAYCWTRWFRDGGNHLPVCKQSTVEAGDLELMAVIYQYVTLAFF